MGREEPGFRIRPFSLGRRKTAATIPRSGSGLDLETYRLILAETLRHPAGKQMTELTGFFAFSKYANMPGHKSRARAGADRMGDGLADLPLQLLPEHRCQRLLQSIAAQPGAAAAAHAASPAQVDPAREKAYSASSWPTTTRPRRSTTFCPTTGTTPDRGKIPLAWGINPNLLETYPDLIAYFYSNRHRRQDTFTADASAAGYMNPNRVPQGIPAVVREAQPAVLP